MECIEDTDTLENLIGELEERIKKNEDTIGFKYYGDVPDDNKEDPNKEDPDTISVL